ncbi:ribosomal protein L4 [Auricularia subglabra TFB-10046 SS5]|nr:ribosomal protein L4 [Auricularia subglabra TFB-10046 SS5]
MSDSCLAVPLPRDPVYIELSNLIPAPAGKQADAQVVALSPDVFRQPIRRDILHLCVVQYRDSLRQGSANTKTRGEVRGSGRKVRPQKGTGRARLGDAQSPMLVGGGIAFGPRPRDFSTKLPRKVRAMGMRVALSARVKERSFIVADSLRWPGVKVAEFVARLKELSWTRCLFITGCGDEVAARLDRVAGNVPHVDVVKVEDLNIHDILRWDRLVVDVEAAEWLENKYHPSAFFKKPLPFGQLASPADLKALASSPAVRASI